MRIVVDGQVLQSAQIAEPARRSAQRLISSLIAAAAEHQVFLVLSDRWPDRIRQIRSQFEAVLPRSSIRVWYAQGTTTVAENIPSLLRESALASLDPDIVLVPFCPDASDAVLSIGLLADIPTAICVIATSAQSLARESAGSPIEQMSRASFVFVPVDLDIAVCGWLSGCAPAKIIPLAEPAELLQRLLPLVAAEAKGAVARDRKPRLAYVSPMLPLRSGISSYSSELLPALAAHFEIDVIVRQRRVADAEIERHCTVRDLNWFARNATSCYDHTLYQFGNSMFHAHMFDLLDEHPGVVTLHDFYLSDVVARMDGLRRWRGFWARQLYESHGYRAALERFSARVTADVVWRYPSSGAIFENADGVIVHSEIARSLARDWYGTDAERRVAVIPHLRSEARVDRAIARRELGLAENDFLVCSFGYLGPTKLNHRLLKAWIGSPLAADPRCKLVFVGGQSGQYGHELLQTMRSSGVRAEITGWADDQSFRGYLAAADLAVQLRTFSRGESSGTVLDCMNYGVPLIVNAHGSMAELPRDAVWMLADQFEGEDLAAVLARLRTDWELRNRLATKATAHIRHHHDPGDIAAKYATALEEFARKPRSSLARLAPALAPGLKSRRATEGSPRAVAASAALSIRPALVPRQLLIDISVLARKDLKTGIERAAKALIREMIARPPAGFRVEPVYSDGPGFIYARRATMKILGAPPTALPDAPIEPRSGDIYFMPDLEHQSVIRNRKVYRAMRDHGVSVNFMVHDLLPIQFPQFFPSRAAALHQEWLKVVVEEADRAICVSRTVAEDLAAWCQEQPVTPLARICHSHHGADLIANPDEVMPRGVQRILRAIWESQSFLMVGTIEPRKGHVQVLECFERLWANGGDQKLVIVGKAGWMVEGLVRKLRSHPERNRRLIWIERSSDEYLIRIYSACSCLIAASHGEGFGLPIIEAAMNRLPIIARDIRIFHEVAGKHALYFDTETPEGLAAEIRRWLQLKHDGSVPRSTTMPHLTWAESAENLKQLLVAS
jgi:glycosyltransferase involved in cell wall biosynthesis